MHTRMTFFVLVTMLQLSMVEGAMVVPKAAARYVISSPSTSSILVSSAASGIVAYIFEYVTKVKDTTDIAPYVAHTFGSASDFSDAVVLESNMSSVAISLEQTAKELASMFSSTHAAVMTVLNSSEFVKARAVVSEKSSQAFSAMSAVSPDCYADNFTTAFDRLHEEAAAAAQNPVQEKSYFEQVSKAVQAHPIISASAAVTVAAVTYCVVKGVNPIKQFKKVMRSVSDTEKMADL